MPIKMIDCSIEDCGIGISAPATLRLDLTRTNIVNCQKAIEIRDPQSILASLGLPEDTPTNLLRETLQTLLRTRELGLKQSAEAAAKTRLFEWLGGVANSTTILANLVSLSQNGLVRGLLESLPK